MTVTEHERDRYLSLPVLIDIEEAALVLRTSTAVVRRLIAGGELAAVTVGGDYRINADSIQAFANRGLREQLEAQLRALARIDASAVTQ
jgi:excisionase family DNA binding protein